MTSNEILLANPRGFCAGVERAIEIVERALERFGAPIYVRHEVVHNKFVVEGLRAKGAVFVEELDEVPAGSTVIFSAHGVPQTVRTEAEKRGLRVFDATCPLVTKVHIEVARMREQGREIVMIGHKGHPEVEGTMGQVKDGIHLVEKVEDVATLDVANPDQLAYVTSPRRRSRSTTRPPSSPRCANASRTLSAPRRTTSATRRRTARTP
jgi:4-hydroxy-3-methylbut-2-en-1-yl diphosphate reductase